MSDSVHEEDYKGYHICIDYEQDPENPRDWDHLGKMVCFHGRYTLGDKHSVRHEDFSSWEEQEEFFRKEMGAVVMLPLYLYDHSGITMSTGKFSCPWDSGRVGTIFVTKDALKKEFNRERLTPEILKRAEEILQGEVKEYDEYLRGNVYRYTITKDEPDDDPGDGEHIDSCGGYLGDYEEFALKEARAAVDHEVAREFKARFERDAARTGMEE